MTKVELYSFLTARGWKFHEIRMLTNYQIRNIVFSETALKEMGRIVS